MKVMVDPALPDHRKIVELAAALGVEEAQALGHVVTLWCRTMSLAPSGSLKDWSDIFIAKSCKWNRNPVDLVKALSDVGFLSGKEGNRRVNDWIEWQGNILEKREAWKEKKNGQRAKSRGKMSPGDTPRDTTGDTPGDSQGDSQESPASVPPLPPVPSRTLPSLSIPIPPSPKETEGGSAPKPPDAARGVTERLVNLWNTGRTSGKTVRVTPKRLSKVRARLKDGFSEDELVLVVKKLLESAWHQGDNDRNWKAAGPEWVLASTEKVEEWISREINNVRKPQSGFSGKASTGQPSTFALRPGDLGGGAQTA